MDGSSMPPEVKLDNASYSMPPVAPEARRATENRSRRRRWLGALAAVVLVLGGGYGTYWFLIGRFYETTNDAYLGADNVTVAPKVAGYVIELNVEDNQRVAKGDVLARIDPRDYQTAVDSAAADLQNAEATAANIDALLAEQQSTIAQMKAAVEADRAAITFSEQESRRYGDLARIGVGSAQRNQQAEADLAQKKAVLERDLAAVRAAEAHTAVLQTQRRQADATIAAKNATLTQARINLEYTTIVAPVDGVVGDRSVRQGQLVQAGAKLMSVVPTDRVYLVANFKETQTGHMTRGQPVSIELDTFPGQTIDGTVESLAPGTGAQFALLPPENATGNFTKIVQRVPVKILLDPKNPLVAKIRPGLSATATVDIRPTAAARAVAREPTSSRGRVQAAQ
ncbi:membrane fusion protein, multidrug efflux system [Enhydrobacter aerosaccus]|uniref:Membrane fusion protein, multidrug efflux system n=1 Tax=Enhydrobacter aerosaccus TaxID=225324 RepID=A0A1T4SWC6_9HYPH|nr:HlyD family secretion protein [Enhydrobacter aerosaccus]SKA32565.1 membrane fusion protein, multidrug efflux system [Enhydrobacter aerosaccus]